jgi:hypothetical protein
MAQNCSTEKLCIAQLIAERQTKLKVIDEQLANASELNNPSTLEMIKEGTIRLPLANVGNMARALDLDAAEFLRSYLGEVLPDMLAAIDDCMLAPSLTQNEAKLVEAYRFLCKGRDAVPRILDGGNVVALISC